MESWEEGGLGWVPYLGCVHEGGVGEGLGGCVVQHLGHTGPDGNARPPHHFPNH